jgi:hypothetical protein
MEEAMVRYLMVIAIVWFWPMSPARLHAQQSDIETDANVLTALDVSDSIDPEAALLQFEGIARAVLDPDFLHTVAAGSHGRVGFSMFTWAAGRNRRVIVPWMVIETAGDAERVAALLAQAAVAARPTTTKPAEGVEAALVWYEFRTDISGTIDFARELLDAAPYRTARGVVNICANGEDNVGEGPAGARDRALAEGRIINALALGNDKELGGYLHAEVQGGPTSFVLEARAYPDFAEAMLRKFMLDLIAARPSAAGTIRG